MECIIENGRQMGDFDVHVSVGDLLHSNITLNIYTYEICIYMYMKLSVTFQIHC